MMAARQNRIIDKAEDKIDMLPEFARRLDTTHFMSSIIIESILIAQPGKAHLMLKSASKPRKGKRECAFEKRTIEEEKNHIQYLKDVESSFKSKKLKFEDALAVIEDNARMIEYMKANGIMDENGNLIGS